MYEFIVESKGYCFLCLNQISSDLGSFSGENSLQYLARYLHLDMRKAFYEGEHDISPKLLDKVQKSKIKAELCLECTKLNNSFSLALRELEKFRMVVRFNLNLIHQKIVNATEHDNLIISKLVANECNLKGVSRELSAKLKITDALRNEAMEKCSMKLRTSMPRVKVQKLTSDELIPIGRMKSKCEDKQLSNPGLETYPQIKTETIQIQTEVDTSSEQDDDNSFTEPEYKPTHVTLSPEVEEKFSPTSRNPNAKGKTRKQGRFWCDKCDQSFTRRHALKKHQLSIHLYKKFPCDNCNKRFSRADQLSDHMLTVHSRQQFQCDKCDRKFSLLSHMKKHQLAIHFGQKFPCDKCSASFTESANLKRHRLSIHFGKRFRCQFCSKTFSQAGDRNLHMKNKCPDRPRNTIK